ncbi:filamentous haemagglutinin family protein [Thiobacillus denitrificans]|uniref:filamentous haemagglutinin family protein n=1 Tax=Thiobacillus denitrificans TaxID=36861 RepID=UPI000376C3E2|nr:filamentous haemagglutinin family protein [Thiobacillus denitrificans]
MNRNRYRLVFNITSGMMVPVAETARRQGKAASGPALALAGVLLAGPVQAELPVASVNFAVPGTTASYQASGMQAYLNQVGNKAIVNFQSFNISAGHNVQLRQVDSLATQNLVQGANFSVLARIHDQNPSVIAGSISQASGQTASLTMVNPNGIAFMGGAQVNLNSFTASSLDIKDVYFLNSFLGDTGNPQFEKDFEGGEGRGFIKVFEGARITAGSQGRVMLIAPTVVNKGSVTAPDGQVIAGAGGRVYLRSASDEDANVRGLLVEVDSPAGLTGFDTANAGMKDGELDGQAVSLANASEDKLGHVTNLGELSTPRGNVTMVGYAVNQLGIARATTSVVSNGSVYLLAKDTQSGGGELPVDSTRSGRVVLGGSSLTEVLPEVADATTVLDGTTGAGLARASKVRVLGQDIRMAGGAVIDAPAAEVRMDAVDDPSTLRQKTSLDGAGTAASDTARIHVAAGARISVAGLENVRVSAARNGVEVELRGDELKDTPANQEGPLRGEKVYVDVNRALARAEAGESTLIAQDSLESYQANLGRTVAERSTAGGSVAIRSQGETILENGVTIDLSGGSVQYTAANVKTTLLSSNGRLVDLADADAATRYDGIATRYVKDYGRWNRKEVIDLGQSYRYDPGYVEGKDAGALDVVGMKAVAMQTADVQGRTTTGELQRGAGLQPAGARLTFGTDAIGDGTLNDYKLNQRVDVSSTGATLPSGFKFGDVLPQALKDALVVNPALMGWGKVATLEIFSNQAAEVREALRAPQGGGVRIVANGLTVLADIEASSGTIDLAARNNAGSVLSAPRLAVGDGVTLSARGAWVNELPGRGGPAGLLPLVNGGKVTLAADVSASGGAYTAQGEIELGENARIDVGSGGHVRADGTLVAGKGGDISVAAYDVEGVADNLAGHATGKGGKLSLASHTIRVGGAPDAAYGTLNLETGLFERGGFADFSLTALNMLSVADDTAITPTVVSLEVQPEYALRPSGSRVEDFARVVKRDDRVRQAAHLSLAAKQAGAGTGQIRVGTGARIEVDPGARIALEARNAIDIQGRLIARGGTIDATLDRSNGAVFGPANLNPIWLGEQAVLDVSGIARTYTDGKGLTQGEVLAGGTVRLDAQTGYVVTEAGSRIDVSGAAPVRLDMPSESGGLGRLVGSDAGTLSVFAEEGMLLDGTLAAHAGSASHRGGSFSATLSRNARQEGQATYDAQSRVLSLAPTVAPQAAGLTPGDAIPDASPVRARIASDALEQAGFDRIALASRDAIRLEDGLNLGAGRTLPLREVKLDAARIETVGGNTAIAADAALLGNYDGYRLGSDGAYSGSGVLKVDARLLELAGNLRLRGMARAELSGSEAVRLRGTTVATAPTRPSARIESAADLAFHGAVVAPATWSQASILAPGRTVSFSRTTDAPVQPLSALGSLTVDAKHIVQDGNLWAPFGQLEFKASESLVFRDGSLTSVAAAPGSLLPFGKLQNGRDWVVDLDPAKVPAGQIAQDGLTEKSIRTEAASIDMQAGARFDLAGGGDLQAWEFTVGPGGSRDILNDKATYAILPGYAGGFAPADPQEGFDRASGEAVYLSGVPGLADGVYTLLPAHYALLPGAYAVKLDSGIRNVLPGQAYSRQDGVRIAAGYVTDSRPGAPKDANWQGVLVMTRDQVRARSEFSLARASQFFADGQHRPQDAGLLSVSTSGSGADALKLDAAYHFVAAPGGRGAQVDISALKLAVASGTPSGIDADAVVLDAGKLNALGADSLLLGGTRSSSGESTTITVGADAVVLANDADHALKAAEVMLAAKDTLTLRAGSAIDAQGESGDAGAYRIAGNGAFVRAASTRAGFARTGSPDRSAGALMGEAESTIAAADSIALDATQVNDFKGSAVFARNGAPVAGRLAVGATRINFGAVPDASEGLTYTQADLDAIDLAELALTSYSSFDLYGGVAVGKLDENGVPVLQNLLLQGAGLAGIDNAGETAQINAKHLALTNPGNASAFTPGGAPGSGTLAVSADTLTLGQGNKKIMGFGAVTVTANELLGSGTGRLDVAAPVTLNVARISGERGADQALHADGALVAGQHAASRALAPVTALGASWTLQGTSVDFNGKAELPSGSFRLTATGGDVTLGANAGVDVAGREVRFFDVTKPSWGGTAEFVSETGNVAFAAAAKVDVSAATGGDAGTLRVRAAQGSVTLADGSLDGASPPDNAGQRGDGARIEVDTGTLASFSALNAAFDSGGFDGARSVRVRNGDVAVAAADTVRAHDIHIAVDGGKLDVEGELDASGEEAGRIELFAQGDVKVAAGAQLLAQSSGAGEDGGDIVIGTRDGSLDLAAGSDIGVSGGAGGQGGTLLLRAPRTGSDVAVGALDSTVGGARSVAVEAVRAYDNIGTLTASGGSGTTLSLATINADNAAYAASHAAIRTRLGKDGDAAFHLLSGVEVRSAGDLTLASDWNLSSSRAGGEAGALTLRAAGNLKLNSNLSDGFSHATPFTTSTGTTPANLLADDSWSYRLAGGADLAAADPLAVVKDAGDVTLAAGKLVRSGTGDIRVAAGRDIRLADNKSVIYTAGRAADAIAGFSNPPLNAHAKFSERGGDVSLAAQRDIVGAASAQLFNNWLFRQGRLNADGSAYTVQPAWWVRFDQFQQGVGALGGGDVRIAADGRVENVSASTPTQARMASATPNAAALVKTGGGTVRVEAGGDVLGGQYYADRGEVVLKAGGKVDSGQDVFNKPVYTILALGDAQARVQARDAVNIHTVMNPHWAVQSSGANAALFNVSPATQIRKSLFSTYSDDSAVSLASLAGAVTLHNMNGSDAVSSLKVAYPALLDTQDGKQQGQLDLLAYLPPTLDATAFQGDILIHDQPAGGILTLVPAAQGKLNLLARDSVKLNATLVMSDRDAPSIPSVARPGQVAVAVTVPAPGQLHAAAPVHAGDGTPARIYALNNDVEGVSGTFGDGSKNTVVNVPKAIDVRAGRDVRDLSILAQHPDSANRSRVQAGRDVRFSSGSRRTDGDRIWIGGPGRLEVTAGRHIDLGTSAGIVSRGDLDNPGLPAGGANIHLAAGVGPDGVDYVAVVDRLMAKLEAGEPDDATLWQARWLTGDATLTAGGALAAVAQVDALDADARRTRVREMLFTALRTSGRDSNEASSPYAADYARGYAALELVFPGIGDKAADGSSAHYQGEMNLFASRVKTERGGDIEFLLPGGDLIVGLANTPAALVNVGNDVLGMVTVADGDIRGFARDDVLVNQSRILTVGGGDVLLWSSEGDIDAGKGKKTATAVPPPVIKVDAQGNVTQELQGAASGSGIGALGTAAGDVDLIAPRGTVNAGDAGIRAGNLNIAAQVVLGADNISVSGSSSGTPVADTSVVTAASSGASNAGGDVSSTTAALAQNLADAARAAEELKQAFRPTFISAEVIGHGD